MAQEIVAGIVREKFCQNSDFVTGEYDSIGGGTGNICGILSEKFCQNSDFVTGEYDSIGSGTGNICGNSK